MNDNAAMTGRDHLITCLIMGAAAGGLGIFVALMIRVGFPLEPVMAFLGALTGATATVAGAVWVADRNHNIEMSREVQILTDALGKLQKSAEHAQALEPTDSKTMPAEYREAIKQFGLNSRATRMIIDQAIQRSKALNFHQMASLGNLHGMVVEVEQFYADCFESPEDLHPADDRSWGAELHYSIELIKVTMRILENP
ncbi:hypothetical protein [Pelagerythrobacter aerophilus]|uniref:Uncharacterized protein n=1 Tax=Pelagerythrobacter aerophilus TaxID=2306995 RepID=A0A418NK72_9SPHN|nr:hypothetical protein [Pelagerythrobacter aerophilus]RIV79562.1 hypothetical protein D2V04_06210 [Pelagerythrobacter aerophilus]